MMHMNTTGITPRTRAPFGGFAPVTVRVGAVAIG